MQVFTIRQSNRALMKYIPGIILATAIGVPPAASQSMGSMGSRERVEKSVFTREIAICSEIESVNEVSVSSFYKTYFAGWKAPVIIDGNEARQEGSDDRLLIIASDGTIGERLRNCLRRQVVEEGALEAFIEPQSQELNTTLGDITGLKLPGYDSIVKVSWYLKDFGNLPVMSFMSIQEEPDRVNHALTYIFGLDMSVCDHSDACIGK